MAKKPTTYAVGGDGLEYNDPRSGQYIPPQVTPYKPTTYAVGGDGLDVMDPRSGQYVPNVGTTGVDKKGNFIDAIFAPVSQGISAVLPGKQPTVPSNSAEVDGQIIKETDDGFSGNMLLSGLAAVMMAGTGSNTAEAPAAPEPVFFGGQQPSPQVANDNTLILAVGGLAALGLVVYAFSK